jgi:radical SAM-linked protein
VSQLKKQPTHRIRLKIQKIGPLRFMSHLDWLRMVHRTMTRAKLPVAFSQGFNPSMKISFGPALPLLMEGAGEYIDVELTDTAEQIQERLNALLPEGGKVLSVQWLPLYGPAIEESIESLSYSARWTCKEPQKEYTIVDRVQFLANQSALPIEVETKKSRKSLDLAPTLTDLRVEKKTVHFTVRRTLGETGQTVYIKPEWVLNLIDSEVQWSVTRTEMVLAELNPAVSKDLELQPLK